MNPADFIFIFFVMVLLAASFIADRKGTRHALVVGYKGFINIISLFVSIFLLIGLFEALIPAESIQAVMGRDVGIFAPFIGAALGGIAAGPPAVIYPVGQFLLIQKASVSAVATLITAFITVGTITLPIEIKYFGKRFAFSRWAITITTSIIVGILMGLIL